ncbi:MAG: twin-arginine translocase subunit TatC [Acidimicrobiales bacterium]|jgi:sec-independent protein translocase protein TatC|nr:twin-arginine translocase subunit TatC [Acidimicrobiales bacterium]
MTRKKKRNPKAQMGVLEHLSELRTRLIICAIAIGAASIIGWILYEQILDYVLDPYCETLGQRCTLRVDEPLEGLSTRFMVSIYTGIGLAVPVWLWQIWRFISPGLYKNERRQGILFVVCGVFLFLLGCSLAFWTLPRALDFLIGIGGEDLLTEFRAKAYISFVIKMMLAFGIGFEFPLVLIILQRLEMLSYKTLRKQWRYAVVGIVVLVAVITPSGDPISLLALAVPMYLFYEISVLYGWARNRRMEKSLLVSGINKDGS